MTNLTTTKRNALRLIAAGGVVAQEFRIRDGARITNRNGDRIRRDTFYALVAAGLITADSTTPLFQGQAVSLTRTGRDTLGVITSTVHTTNTRPHQVRAIGQQHIDDQAPMGQCTVCETVGEWNALTNLAPNAYGCSGRAPHDS